MRYIITFTIIAIILSLALVLPVSAADTPELTVIEAEELIVKMDELYWKLQLFPNNIDAITVEYGAMDSNGRYSSALMCKPEYTYDDFVMQSKAIYTDDYAIEMLALTRTMYYVDGEVILTSLVPQWEPYNANGDGLVSKDDFKIDPKVTVDSNNIATIEFNYVHIEHPLENGAVIKRSNVTAVLEDGEWQINGGDYIDILREYHSNWDIIYPNSAPQTGFATYAYAAVAVVAAAGAVAVAKRRRKAI